MSRTRNKLQSEINELVYVLDKISFRLDMMIKLKKAENGLYPKNYLNLLSKRQDIEIEKHKLEYRLREFNKRIKQKNINNKKKMEDEAEMICLLNPLFGHVIKETGGINLKEY